MARRGQDVCLLTLKGCQLEEDEAQPRVGRAEAGLLPGLPGRSEPLSSRGVQTGVVSGGCSGEGEV